MPKASEGKPETYLNPVYPHSFPDPFVLKFKGEYFAYCTGDASDGNLFGILHSTDLVNWTYVGSAMEPLASRPPFYWAPEVVYDNGKFYCYYSAGNEILMEIRVAVSDRPDGGFIDAGVRLTKEEFAIDAHVFIDDDGTLWMFYATDFLEHSHIGTGTVVDRMLDWKTLAKNPWPVTRAKYDWQVYDPARKEKGGVRWHTVEGPTVLKHKGKYFEMFSGGNWQNKSYGVSFAVADSMNFNDEWEQFSDGENILPILRTIPDLVVGPGHNSVVRGVNNRELYCVYHRWTEAGRVLAIDRMDFAGDRLFVAGPTTTPQPLPFQHDSKTVSTMTGWSKGDGDFVSNDEGPSELTLASGGTGFLLEFWVRFDADGTLGLHADEKLLFELNAPKRRATFQLGNSKKTIELDKDFDPSAWHRVRCEAGLSVTRVSIDHDGYSATLRECVDADVLTVLTDTSKSSIAAIELTRGFEELFDQPGKIPGGLIISGKAKNPGRQLNVTPSDGHKAELIFDIPFENFEVAANLSLSASSAAAYGIELKNIVGEVARLAASPSRSTIIFNVNGENAKLGLPESFSGNEFRQFKIIARSGSVSAYLDGIHLATTSAPSRFTSGVLFSEEQLNVDMLRVTELYI